MTTKPPTKIGWCDWTVNPWHGCRPVSPACDHCYAADQDRRWGKDCHGDSPRQLRVLAAIRELEAIEARLADQRAHGSVFVMSMGDLFEDHPDLRAARIFFLLAMRSCLHIDFLILTKRPQNIIRMVRDVWPDTSESMPANWWLGTTVESHAHLVERLPSLYAASVELRPSDPLRTYLSVEPMLRPVYLRDWFWNEQNLAHYLPQWVICGCERFSGNRPGRPMTTEYADNLAEACADLRVPFYLKQFSAGHSVTTDLSLWRGDPRTARREFPPDLRHLGGKED